MGMIVHVQVFLSSRGSSPVFCFFVITVTLLCPFMCSPGLSVATCQVFCFCFCLLFRAALEACAGSQARGRIRATATGLHHNHSSRQCWILNPLSEARDQTSILTDTSRVHTPLSHNKNSCSTIILWILLG